MIFRFEPLLYYLILAGMLAVAGIAALLLRPVPEPISWDLEDWTEF